MHLILFGKSSVMRMFLLHLGHLHFALFQSSSSEPGHDCGPVRYIRMTTLECTYPHLQRKIASKNIADAPGCLSRLAFARLPRSPARISSADVGLKYAPPSESRWSFPHFGQWYKISCPISIPLYLGHQSQSSGSFGSIILHILSDIIQYISFSPSESHW